MISPEGLPGHFSPLTFPCQDLTLNENPSVHLFDIVSGFQDDFNVEEVSRQYIRACEEGDLSLLPAPIGLKKAVPHGLKKAVPHNMLI